MPAQGRLTWRLLALVLVLFVSTGGLVARLVQLQVVEHGRYAQEAFEEHYAERETYALRGSILDRNGHPLVTSTEAWDVYVSRVVWEEDSEDATESAQGLTRFIGGDPANLLSYVLTDRNGEVLTAEAIDYNLGLQIKGEKLIGVRLEESSRRVYPEGGIASPILGYLGRDRLGLTGIELLFNEVLAGRPGRTIYEQDGLRNRIALGALEVQAPEAGGNVVLTIDRGVQRAVERALDQAISERQAIGGSAIVMDPNTGEILAMASRPSVDNTALDFSADSNIVDLSRLRAISDLYEPGSPFKLITMAAALDIGAVTPEMTYYDSGAYSYSDKKIQNWDRSANGTQSMLEVLKKSLNTGAIFAAQAAGTDIFYDYLSRFGFAQPTGIDLPGEAAGLYRLPADPAWSPLDLATNSFGQGINVTPLEMLNAVAAIANGGELMRPYLIKEVHTVEGIQRTGPVVIRRVISEQTSQTLRDMMVQVVDGISEQAGIPGYRIAGKTGTSSIYSQEIQAYDDQRVIVSFVGIVPANAPRFVVLVKIDEPAGVAYGSTVAAPVFQNLAEQIVALLNVKPDEGALVQRGEE
ncbi:MAG: penicillin-binding protein 2 [Dehalococcoidia bacterium]